MVASDQTCRPGLRSTPARITFRTPCTPGAQQFHRLTVLDRRGASPTCDALHLSGPRLGGLAAVSILDTGVHYYPSRFKNEYTNCIVIAAA